MEKTANGETTRYLYVNDKVVLETDGSNKEKAFQVYGSGTLLYREAAADSGTGTQSYYYLYNAHGDVTGLVDAEGNIAATYDYDAFGNILSETGAANNSIKYAGYQHDKESGLYYLNARYYDSVTARFISEDTYRGKANDPLSLNLYTYCQNNPICYTDPSGHASKTVHYSDTEKIAYDKFCDYIETESEKIVVYKKNKKGKDTKTVDKKATEKKRTDWIDDQKDKAKDYAKALASGDEYVDESKILLNTKDKKTENDYDYRYFHAFNVQGNTKRAETVTSIVKNSKSAAKYYMTGKGEKPSLELTLEHAKYKITTSTVSKTETVPKLDDKTGKQVIDKKTKKPATESKTTCAILPLGDYTNTEKALFVSGMGLHTLQDSNYHVTEKHNTDFSDDNNFDYVDGKWSDDNKHDFTIDGVDKTFTGGDRYEKTLNATGKWVDDLLDKYGDKMFETK